MRETAVHGGPLACPWCCTQLHDRTAYRYAEAYACPYCTRGVYVRKDGSITRKAPTTLRDVLVVLLIAIAFLSLVL